MSVLEEVLVEEYSRSVRLSRSMERELATIPKGSVQRKKISGRTYHYLVYREGKKVRTRYIRAAELEATKEKVKRGRDLRKALKEQEKARGQIERALGRSLHVESAAAGFSQSS